jgi:hypothetical protein
VLCGVTLAGLAGEHSQRTTPTCPVLWRRSRLASLCLGGKFLIITLADDDIKNWDLRYMLIEPQPIASMIVEDFQGV